MRLDWATSGDVEPEDFNGKINQINIALAGCRFVSTIHMYLCIYKMN